MSKSTETSLPSGEVNGEKAQTSDEDKQLKRTMKAEPLPYDIGNSGDLIKHGMIAEFAKWWSLHNQDPFIFYDPFGGRPWVEPLHKKVTERLLRLNNCALATAQPEPCIRYYGSGHIIKNVARYVGNSAKVLVSDRNKNALDDLIESGLERITHKNYISENGYSILDCNLSKSSASLLLLDPFADFLESSTRLLPEIIQFVAKVEVAVALFVLSDESMSVDYRKFNALRKSEFVESTLQLSFSCPQLRNTGIRGEERYRSDVILFLPVKYRVPQLEVLKNSLKKYAGLLTQALGQEIQFSDFS